MNKKKLKLLAVPIAVASASVIGMVSGTLAYFTSIDKATVSIEAGQVKVSIALSNLKTYSLDVLQKAEAPYTFENGGTASISGTAISLNKITPGDKVTFDLDVTNHSNVDMKYKLKARYANEVAGADPHNLSHSAKLSEGLVVSGLDSVTQWTNALVATSGTKIVSRSVSVELPKEAGNEYQNATSDIFIEVEAIQKNGPVNNSYGFYDSYKEGGVWYHEITNKAQFQNIMANILETKQGVDYSDPAINDETAVYIIMNDIDFNGNAWHDDVNNVDLDPTSFTFKGTLMGNDLIGSKVKLKNITLTSDDAYSMRVGKNDPGLVALFDRAYAATFKNITLSNIRAEDLTHEYAALFAVGNKGAISDASRFIRFENCEVDELCVVSGSAQCSAFLGCARNLSEVTFKNCINRANVTTTSNMATAFVANGSAETSVPCVFTFDGCKNYGEMTAEHPAGFIGYATIDNHSVVIKNSGSYGNLYCTGSAYKAGIFSVGNDKNQSIYENNESKANIFFTTNLPTIGDDQLKGNADSEYKGLEKTSNNNIAFTDLNTGTFIDTKEEYLTLCKKGYEKIDLGFNSTTNKLESPYTNPAVDHYTLVMRVHAIKVTATGAEYGTGPAPTSEGENLVFWSKTAATVDALDILKVEREGFFVPSGFAAPDATKIPYAKFARYTLDPATAPGSSYVGQDGYYSDTVNGYGYFIISNNAPGEFYNAISVWRNKVAYMVTGYNSGGETIAYGSIENGYAGDQSTIAGMDGGMGNL